MAKYTTHTGLRLSDAVRPPAATTDAESSYLESLSSGKGMTPLFAPDGSDLPRAVWRLAWPVINENLLITLLFLVDTWMVTSLGSVSLAASGLASIVMYRLFMMTGCIDRGVAAMVARFIGECNIERASRTAAQGLLTAIIIGLPLTVVGMLFSASFLRWMGADAEVVAVGSVFLQAVFASSSARLLQVVAGGILRASGDTKTPMWIMIGANIVNLFLNWVLIFGHFGFSAMGLFGSGIATSIAVTGAAVITTLVLWGKNSPFRIKMSYFKPEPHRLKVLLRLSLPVLFDEMMVSAGFLAFYMMITDFGTNALAAHTIAVRIEGLSYNVGAGFIIAAATLVGQGLGAYGPRLASQAMRAVMVRSFLTLSAISLVLIMFPVWFVSVFDPTPDIGSVAVVILILSAIAEPFMAISYVLAGGLRGAGDTFSPMVISIFTNIFMRIGATWFCAYVLGMGLWGLYVGVAIEWFVRSVLLYVAYKKGHWQNIDLS
ncbi:MAG: MATE family efflux transporter [Candidatus Sumerlaeales bacterium]|nr:MATE family efflux transporter [Candidatus Sumerlaeales bacterium]